MRRQLTATLAAALGAATALILPTGMVRAQGAINDPRILSLPAASSGTLSVETAPDVLQTFLFAPGARITAVELSDPQAFYVVVSGTADSLTLRGARPGAQATMTVRTQERSYSFALRSASSSGDAGGSSTQVPRVVRLVPPMTASSQFPARPMLGPKQRHSYKLSGEKALRPSSIYDDGDKTYISWAPDQALPATFGLGPTGEEQMIDGYMRGGTYTLDRVYTQLIFRIDRKKAEASRIEGTSQSSTKERPHG